MSRFYGDFDPAATADTAVVTESGFSWNTSVNSSYYTFADNFTVQRSGSASWGYPAVSTATFTEGKFSIDIRVNALDTSTKRTNFGIVATSQVSLGGSNWLSKPFNSNTAHSAGVQDEDYSTADVFTLNVNFDDKSLELLQNNSSVDTDSFSTSGNFHIAIQEYDNTSTFEVVDQVYAPPAGFTKITPTGGVLSTTTDTRSHSHVWNYPDVYDARFADTWPTTEETIIFKVWGAGGGGTAADGGAREGAGGGGGFAQGTITADAGTEFLLTVGSGGPHTAGGNNQQIPAGTYGGGGAGYAEEQDGGAGGGFSGVFTGSRSQGNAIIIAGGGGGGASYNGSNSSGGGGGGGGETGRNGAEGNFGDGGSQSAGGSGGGGNATDGSALQGGRGGNKGAGQNRAGGGGGGGYYGGGGGGAQNNGGDGGGGSGYVGGNSSYTPSSTTNTQGSDGTSGASTNSATGGTVANAGDSDYPGSNKGDGGGKNASGNSGAIAIIVGGTTTVYATAGEFTFTVS